MLETCCNFKTVCLIMTSSLYCEFDPFGLIVNAQLSKHVMPENISNILFNFRLYNKYTQIESHATKHKA